MPEALSEELDMPVDVKWGHVGLFHLSVPWSKLGSKPVRCLCAGFLHAGPDDRHSHGGSGATDFLFTAVGHLTGPPPSVEDLL